MDDRPIFLYPHAGDGVTEKASATLLTDWGASETAGWQANPPSAKAKARSGSERGDPSSEARDAGSREKLLAGLHAARTKTDTGGQGEKPEVSERTVAKELGKTAPYVRKKGRWRRPAAVKRPKRLFI